MIRDPQPGEAVYCWYEDSRAWWLGTFIGFAEYLSSMARYDWVKVEHPGDSVTYHVPAKHIFTLEDGLRLSLLMAAGFPFEDLVDEQLRESDPQPRQGGGEAPG